MGETVNTLVIPILTFLSVMAIGLSILLWKLRSRKIIESRLTESYVRTTNALRDSKPEKAKSKLLRFFESIGNYVSHGHSSTDLWQELVRAGFYSKAAPAVYTGIKMLLFLFGIGFLTILLLPVQLDITRKVTLIGFISVCLFFLPNIILTSRVRKRRDEITLYLPDAVDLLEICVSSGIGLGSAWNIVAREIGNVSPVLGDAMAFANFEIHLGISRVDAMRRMATRTGVEKLSSLAATLVQTERFGTSVSTALKEFAQSLREERFFTAEENAEKTAVKLIIPMVLFIFPSVFIVTAGPSVIEIAKMMATY